MESSHVIEVRGLTKRFGSFTALDDVSFDVHAGEVFGYLGPNGSGKSTTIRILLDLLHRSSGDVTVLGADPRRSGARERARVGYLPGELTLWPRMSVREAIERLAHVRRLTSMDTAWSLADRFDLDLSRDVGHLSKGNRQKVGLVQAFMHDPELVILDEPTTGLDPVMQREFAVLVREWAAAGRTVFVSSHVMEEVERLVDRVAIIHESRIRLVETLDELRAGRPQRITVELREPDTVDQLDTLDGVTAAARDGDALTIDITIAPGIDPAPVLAHLGTWRIARMEASHGSLEEVFLEQLADAESDSDAEAAGGAS